MFQDKQLERLAERKRLLLAVIAMRRDLLAAEARRLEASCDWVPKAARVARLAVPVALALAAPAGIASGRKRGLIRSAAGLAGLAGRGLTGIQLARKGFKLWRTFVSRPDNPRNGGK